VDALLYSMLFWPALLEVDGAILLRASVEDDHELARLRASVRERGVVETEKSFNLREFSDLFGNGLAEIDDDLAEVLLARLAEMWRCRLGTQSSGQRFEVEAGRRIRLAATSVLSSIRSGASAPSRRRQRSGALPTSSARKLTSSPETASISPAASHSRSVGTGSMP
jgi:hypothetical protein